MLVTVTAPSGSLLADPAVVAASLGQGSPDSRLSGLTASASRACAAWVGRPLGFGQFMETLCVSGRSFGLSRFPVASLVTFIECGQPVDPTTYEIESQTGRIAWIGYEPMRCGWPRQVQITYDAGYVLFDAGGDPAPTPTVPDDIQQACIEVVKGLWFSTGANVRDPSIRSEAVEGIGSTSWLDPQPASGGLPMLATTLLQPYRRYGC